MLEIIEMLDHKNHHSCYGWRVELVINSKLFLDSANI